jgi:hypothetical protein
MKVVFIDEVNNLKSGNQYFTLYKVYDANPSNIFDEKMYLIKNDAGYEVNVKKSRFITLAQHRDNKINEILDL